MQEMSVLIDEFVNASIKYGEGQEEGNSKIVNKQVKLINKISSEIKQNYGLENEIFEDLLKHQNDYVKLHTAFSLLGVSPRKAEDVLIELSTKRGLLGFEAKMTIQEWKKGNLKT